MPDYATFGEMLLIGLSEANKFLEETPSSMRFKENIELGDEVYCIFSARKKNGKPKEGEPGKSRAKTNVLLPSHASVRLNIWLAFNINSDQLIKRNLIGVCLLHRLARELEDQCG